MIQQYITRKEEGIFRYLVNKETMLRKKHKCTLNIGSDSMISKKLSKPMRLLLKLFVPSPLHPEIYEYFRSYPAMVAERQRQQYENFIWGSLMIPVRLMHIFASHFRLTMNVPPYPLQFKLVVTDYIILGLDVFCLLNILVRFNMGYVGFEHSMVLDRKSITRHYIRSWFFIDLFTSLPFAFFLIYYKLHNSQLLLAAHITAMLKITHICTILRDLRRFTKLFVNSYIWQGVIRQATLFVVITHVCCCYLYLCPILFLYWNGYYERGYTHFLGLPDNKKLYLVSEPGRYRAGIYICLSSLFGASYHTMFPLEWPDEIAVISSIIVFTSLFMIYNLVFFMKVYFTCFDSTMRYYELMNEVEAYMRQKQFPSPLKRRVIAFYNYTFHEVYFREDNALHYLSEQLRNEITLQTCHKLVNKVGLFNGLPAPVVGEILGRLHPEVYLPNDLVVRAPDIGTCMYFIANGCVAVYSLKGVEVCHLEDGAHFGEVALIMKDRKRVASVVAVEITQVYRLDEADFRHFVMSSTILYERVESLASKRMHETVLLDEKYRREQEKKNTSMDNDQEGAPLPIHDNNAKKVRSTFHNWFSKK
ncbi:potassium/sodium hyperpolarization-activated cyclic nucleotide-gated channel 3-like isoform X2 [Plodia interpunctella]|uniref:potassium/sodium hyperpolarization-activated cyclic nucleotide-gated channel 3-like isoform X2 n=1 Tax=Plodia interpunctella TaxID=58824 RepID=UPI0023674535|nr:potassium/sodium hyperpolarization-activated cyclic nucleotide-gated channel 3-like isoform X2 [Plodia interpunctella]